MKNCRTKVHKKKKFENFTIIIRIPTKTYIDRTLLKYTKKSKLNKKHAQVQKNIYQNLHIDINVNKFHNSTR